jgi:hypothetical protein
LASPSSPGRGKSFPKGGAFSVAGNFAALSKSSPFGRAVERSETERVSPHAGGLFLRHSLREAGCLAKFDFLNEATLKKQLRQHGKIQHVWQGWNFANRERLCQVGKHQKLNVDKL